MDPQIYVVVKMLWLITLLPIFRAKTENNAGLVSSSQLSKLLDGYRKGNVSYLT